jgi:hypothetical protein
MATTSGRLARYHAVFAFQDRHENKDAYDLIFTLLNGEGGPRAVGRAAAASPARR